MRGSQSSRPRPTGPKSATLLVLLVLTACGSGAPSTPRTTQDFSAKFDTGPIVFAVEAAVELTGEAIVEEVSFTVQTKPGNLSEDVHVTYARSFLDRTNAINETLGTVRIPVFGLYADYDNHVTIRVEFVNANPISRAFTITTPAIPAEEAPPVISVQLAAPELDMSFMLLQGHRAPTIYDIDGEPRWQAPPAPIDDLVFPRAYTPEGIVVASQECNAIYQVDWLGRVQTSALNDACYWKSHHNMERGKTGLLNMVGFREGDLAKRLTSLVEMTSAGAITHEWDFDQIFKDQIEASGEDPTPFVQTGKNWFHMNSAIYDASDDSVIVSSRENGVVKVDYATGAIKWILGNSAKVWFRDFPLSLQPLALTVQGEPPIGQHALSVSPDGKRVMLFNNGKGNNLLEDVGDARTYSMVSIYEIDALAGTAVESWTYDFDLGVYSPICSSAYWTAAGNVFIVASVPVDESPACFLVVNEARESLFEACIEGPGCTVAYAAEEIRLDALRLE